MRTLLEQVGGTPSPFPTVNPQTADVILARAQAGTCAGCHQLSPGDVVRENGDGTVVNWPAVAGAFVHVGEDRVLSPALEESFLPFRRYVLGHHLCPPPAPAVAAAPAEADVEAALAFEEAPRARSASSMRFVDAIVADFVATSAPSAAAAAPAAAATSRRRRSVSLTRWRGTRFGRGSIRRSPKSAARSKVCLAPSSRSAGPTDSA